MGFVDTVKVTIKKFVVGKGQSMDSVGNTEKDIAQEKLQAFITKCKKEYKRREDERHTGSAQGE